jgi:smad nuclear-interacting protein 1
MKVIKPYIMDLGSTHRTFLNKKELEDSRYYELRERDSISFGGSSREYLLLHDSSAGVPSDGTGGGSQSMSLKAV